MRTIPNRLFSLSLCSSDSRLGLAARRIGLTTPSVTPSSPTTCDNVQFSATATSNCATNFTYDWDFGDGSLPHGAGSSPTHQYSSASPVNPGYYVVNAMCKFRT
ncbi:MAG: hypothetical protein JWQ02_822 [Capsulimonas sp.]|jgi:hypothetical protein|nr:hypothetical protein [Capsulimonas sp.]